MKTIYSNNKVFEMLYLYWCLYFTFWFYFLLVLLCYCVTVDFHSQLLSRFFAQDKERLSHLEKEYFDTLLPECDEKRPWPDKMSLALILNAGACMGSFYALKNFVNIFVNAYKSNEQIFLDNANDDQGFLQLLYALEKNETNYINSTGKPYMAIDVSNKIYQTMSTNLKIFDKNGRINITKTDENRVYNDKIGTIEIYNKWTKKYINIVHFNGWKKAKMDKLLVDVLNQTLDIDLLKPIDRGKYANDNLNTVSMQLKNIPFETMCPQFVSWR